MFSHVLPTMHSSEVRQMADELLGDAAHRPYSSPIQVSIHIYIAIHKRSDPYYAAKQRHALTVVSAILRISTHEGRAEVDLASMEYVRA